MTNLIPILKFPHLSFKDSYTLVTKSYSVTTSRNIDKKKKGSLLRIVVYMLRNNKLIYVINECFIFSFILN